MASPSFSQAIMNDMVVTTPDRKEIWIVNDRNGQMIYHNWKMNPTYNGFTPTVTLVDDLKPYRKKVKKMIKKSKKSK
jgi:hypothetical protein